MLLNKQKRYCFICFLFLILTACTMQGEVEQETAPTRTPESPATPIPTETTLTTQSSPPLQNIISESDIREIWWSPDSKTLFFDTQFSGSFAYNLESGETAESNSQIPSFATPHPETLVQLPPYYRVHISPSGNRALYSTFVDIRPTATLDPDIEGGEIVSPRQDTEMWLSENGDSRPLGIIWQCQLEDSFWSTDEQRVVLVEYGIPMPICYDPNGDEPQAWLIDLPQETTSPLFPEAEFPPLQVYGFSPNGEQLLHGFFSDLTGANLHLLNVDTFTSKSLDAPVYDVIQWLNDREILVSFSGESTNLRYPVGVLNVESLEITELTPTLTDTYIGNVALSPNQQWLALTTGEGWFMQDKLWLLEVDLAQHNRQEE